MVSHFNARAFVKDFETAINSKEPEKLLAYYAEDAEAQDPSLAQPVRGKAALRKNFDVWSRALSEMRCEIQDIVQSGESVAILFNAQARQTGEMELAPGETIPATNKVAKLDVAEFLTIDSNGRITRDRTIFDVASMMMQLGLLPSPQSSAQGLAPSRR